MTKAYSIKIFLPGGDPDGLRTIEKSNWSGAGIVIPRALMPEARSRKELSRAGVYVLVGPPEESGLPRVYVGEGDPIKPRLEQHAAKKDFWTSCIAFTSKDEYLNKAHVQYIESRLLALAGGAKRCLLDNGNEPALPSLSEADAAEAEGFFDEMLLCFPVLGVNFFTQAPGPARRKLVLHLSGKGVKARGFDSQDGFVVLKASAATKTEVPSCIPQFKQLRAALLMNGVLKESGSALVFTQDYLFASPSTAAGVVLGRSANGRTEWKTEDGRTLKDLQEAGAE